MLNVENKGAGNSSNGNGISQLPPQSRNNGSSKSIDNGAASGGKEPPHDKQPKDKSKKAPKPDPLKNLTEAQRRLLERFASENLSADETSAIFLARQGARANTARSKEAESLILDYARQKLVAANKIIPDLQEDLQKLKQQERLIRHRIGVLRREYDLEDPEAENEIRRPKSFRNLTFKQQELMRAAIVKAESTLHKTVIGQPQAHPAVVRPLKKAVTGVSDANRPLASLFFAGGTGLGKTFTAETLAESLKDIAPGLSFDLLRIDCGEFQGKHEASSRSLGAPPGYIGFDKGGLFDPLKKNPFHVVVFDEIEKAHHSMHELLLQILERGEATMANGDKVSFKNCIIIMTSNVGTAAMEKANNHMGLVNTDQRDADKMQRFEQEAVNKALSHQFAPEFLNRIDQKVYFNKLKQEDFKIIAQLEANKVIERAQEFNHTQIEVLPEVFDFLVEHGASNQFGARNMRRTVQVFVEEPLAEELFKGNVPHNFESRFIVEMKDGKPSVRREPRHLPALELAS